MGETKIIPINPTKIACRLIRPRTGGAGTIGAWCGGAPD
jgi:hypothetical protein